MNALAAIPQPFSVPQLAHRWGCSEGLIRKMIREGRLQCFRPGTLIRISAAEVERFECQQQMTTPTASSGSGEGSPLSGMKTESAGEGNSPRASRMNGNSACTNFPQGQTVGKSAAGHSPVLPKLWQTSGRKIIPLDCIEIPRHKGRMNWKTYLKPSEVERLAELAGAHRATVAERRRIYDRCKKRMRNDKP